MTGRGVTLGSAHRPRAPHAVVAGTIHEAPPRPAKHDAALASPNRDRAAWDT